MSRKEDFPLSDSFIIICTLSLFYATGILICCDFYKNLVRDRQKGDRIRYLIAESKKNCNFEVIFLIMARSNGNTAVENFHLRFKKVPKWLLTVLCLGGICWLTLVPDPFGQNEPLTFEGADKIAHGVMFFGLTLCMCLDTLRARRWHTMGLPLVAALALLSMCIGIIIEIVQPFFGRGFEMWDMGADIFGSIAGGALWIIIGGALGITDGERAREKSLSGDKNE